MIHNPQQIPAAVQAMEPIIRQYGYVAVGGLLFFEDFGILVPGETVLVASAFYAGLGQLNIVSVALVGFVAAVLGDNIGFAIGNYGGHPLIEKYGRYVFLTKSRIDDAEKFFNRHGGKVVTIARFVDGLRQLNGIIAGISEMQWPRFILFNVIGAALWVGMWSSVGYYGGSHINLFLHFEFYFSAAIISLIILRFAYKRYIKPKLNQAKSTEA